MPWIPELFSTPVLERVRNQAADAQAMAPVPYFAGVMSGETDALVRSFAGEPELHHPIRGRVRGRPAFERFVTDANAWLTERNAATGDVERLITPRRGVEEMVLTLDTGGRRIALPIAIVADRDDDARIIELRIYYGTWPLTGRHAGRPPLLQPGADLLAPDAVGEYQRAIAGGDRDGAVAAFEADAYIREPAGGTYVHRGPDELVAFHALLLSGGGITLEHCSVTDDGRTCALEYNAVGRGSSELPPRAGLAVYVRGASGRLAGVRIYDDRDQGMDQGFDGRDSSLGAGP